jgi:hypothetical protein
MVHENYKLPGTGGGKFCFQKLDLVFRKTVIRGIEKEDPSSFKIAAEIVPASDETVLQTENLCHQGGVVMVSGEEQIGRALHFKLFTNPEIDGTASFTVTEIAAENQEFRLMGSQVLKDTEETGPYINLVGVFPLFGDMQVRNMGNDH